MLTNRYDVPTHEYSPATRRDRRRERGRGSEVRKGRNRFYRSACYYNQPKSTTRCGSRVAPKFPAMVGKAVVTMVLSKAARKSTNIKEGTTSHMLFLGISGRSLSDSIQVFVGDTLGPGSSGGLMTARCGFCVGLAIVVDIVDSFCQTRGDSYCLETEMNKDG